MRIHHNNCVRLCFLIPLISACAADLNVIRALDQAQIAREEKVLAYTVTETYTLRNARFSEAAEMVVNVTYTQGTGKIYKIVSRRGPPFLHTNVMERMLKAEAEMSHGDERKNALVTSANYLMVQAGEQELDGRHCDILELTPRKKSPNLLRGKAWVNSRTHNLLRIEGKPAASPSFWAGHPYVVRDYTEIGDFSFARRSEATAQSFLLGRSDLTIDYTDYRIGPPTPGPVQ